MKRFALLAVLAGLFLPTLAHAQVANGAIRWTWDQLSWRTQSTTFLRLAGDSSVACGAAAGRIDTTTAIDISDWQPMPKTAANAVDSTLFAILHVYAAGTGQGLTDVFDSLFVNIQVSQDGVNWATTTPNSGGIIGFNTTNNTGGFVIDNTATNTFAIHFKLNYTANVSGPNLVLAGGTAPDWRQIFGWRYLRILARSGTNTGCQAARIGHWTVKN